MNVAILSMHRIINTGSFLQAIALKRLIEKNGHTVEFLDHYNPNLKNDCYTPSVCKLKRKLRMLKKRLNEGEKDYFYSKRWDMFVYELFDELGCGLKYNYTTSKYDLIVVGSDEVFNCTQEDSFWFGDMIFFGKGLEDKKLCSYAASFGYTTLERLDNFGFTDDVADGLSSMKYISVRDAHSFEMVRALTGIEANINLDPVLIYGFDAELPKRVRDKDYLLVYSYDGRIKEKEYIQEIKSVARDNNLKTISVNFYQDWCDENIVVHPFEVLAYFKNAKYVVTDTFHGAVMSIKYLKQFAVITRDSNKEKITGLLDIVGLRNRLWRNDTKLSDLLEFAYNRKKVESVIADEIEKTEKYLLSIC